MLRGHLLAPCTALLLGLGCADALVDVDAGITTTDAGITTNDAGAAATDASAAPDARDAAPDTRDAAPDTRDAAADAGPQPPDAGPLACPATTTATLSRDRIALAWWPGDDPPVVALTLAVSEPTCTALIADTTAPWLVARTDVSAGAGTLTLRVVAGHVVSGDHAARVELRTAPGQPTLARVDVTLRALVSPGAGAPRRVLVVGLDGVRADALALADTPVIDDLARHGFGTLEARTQDTGPTLSGPGWSSILTGVESNRHRIFANTGWEAFDRQYRTFLDRARNDAQLPTAAACNWTPILDEILEPTALDTSARGSDDAVTRAMVATLAAGLHAVHFVHLNDPDEAGHATGFATYDPAYVSAIEEEDARIGRLVDALFARPTLMDEDWLIIVTTDHGGEGLSHGALNEACRRIPLIVSGTAALRTYRASAANHMDVAATVARFLGLPEGGPALDGAAVGIAVEGRCADGVDDDDDGDLDCGDADCALDPRCTGAAPTCPDADLGSARGIEIARANTATAAVWRSGSCGGGAGRELTFTWRAPADDLYAFDTIGSDFDTVLYLRRGCDGAEVACNQDFYPGPRQDVPINTQSGVRVRAQAGESLVLVVDGASAGASGTVVLSAHGVEASCPGTDLGSTTGPALARGNNSAAPTRHVASCAGMARDAVLTWTAPAEADYLFSTEGSSFDTVLVLASGCGATELACNDDRGGGSLQSRVVRHVAAGEVVTVIVGGFRGRSGDWVLGVEAQ